jgi:hypothetical protein
VFATRAAATAALVVGSAGLVSGCSDGESKADPGASSSVSSAAPLPDNLCSEVLGVVSAEWQLSEESHQTEAPTASCELVGPGDTTLRATLTGLPDRDAATAALDLVCRAAVGSRVGEGQRRCELASDREPGQPYSAAFAASYAETSSVVVVQLRTADDTVALAAPGELASIEAALQSR